MAPQKPTTENSTTDQRLEALRQRERAAEEGGGGVVEVEVGHQLEEALVVDGFRPLAIQLQASAAAVAGQVERAEAAEDRPLPYRLPARGVVT
ncbi:MAG: hypothetical protein IH916_05375 [Acidobacteria bacterium]|nr:hypothetical protein [Acidobacteriota bacterium]